MIKKTGNLSFECRDGGYEGERVSRKWTVVDRQSIMEARDRLLNDDLVRRDIAAQFIGGVWDYDSEGMDALLQIICFGEIVFG